MKITVNENYEIELSEVSNAVVIATARGKYGICQRDWGIEVVKDGKIVFRDIGEPRKKCTTEWTPSRESLEKCGCTTCLSILEICDKGLQRWLEE